MSISISHYAHPITIEKEGKRYYAYSEDLHGVYGLGSSIDKAKTSMLDAIRIYLIQGRKTGGPVAKLLLQYQRPTTNRPPIR